MADPLVLAQMNLKETYKNDAEEFIKELVRIEDRDATGLAIPFTLWDAQKDVLETFLNSRLAIALKARQLGLTWLALAFAVWRMVFTPGYAVVALSKRESDAKELTRRVEFILRYLPKWLVRERKTTAKTFQGPTWEAFSMSVTIHHPNGEPSVFTSMSASPDSGRSFTANLVILDEWAFQEYASQIWSAAYPTVNRPTGGQVIGLSTAKRGTFFEKMWNNAVDKLNGFTSIFLPWSADPRRTREWYEQVRKDMAVENDPDQNYHTEYPETSEEAFMYAGNAVFNIEKVMTRIKELKQVYQDTLPLRGNIQAKYTDDGDPTKGTEVFTEDVNGWLTVYELPQPGVPYCIGADSAEGGLDWSVMQVLDNTTGRQVATWRAHTDTDVLAKEAYKLGNFYNQALLAVEVNFDLHPVKELERLKYRKQYYRETIDSTTNKRQQKHGFRTTTATRGPIIGDLVSVVRDEPELINDLTTLNEMLTFIRNDNGKPSAPEGKHDDCIMSLAIAHKAREQQTMKKAETQKLKLEGTYHVGELQLLGYKPWQIKRMVHRGDIKLLGRLPK